MLEPWVRRLILETIDPWESQEPELTKEELLHALEVEHEEEDVLYIGSQKANFVMMARYITPWVAEVHVFGQNKDGWALVRAAKKASNWLFMNVGFHKLECKAHIPKVLTLIKRCGWKLEGTHPDAIKLKDGTFTHEYSYGKINEQSMEKD